MLIADIADTRTTLGSLALSKTLLVGNADAGSYFNTLVLKAVDYGVRTLSLLFGFHVHKHVSLTLCVDGKCSSMVCECQH